MKLPDHMIKIRDEAIEEMEIPHVRIGFNLGFNKCYEVMAEEIKWRARNPSAYPSAMCYAEHLEKQLAEKEQAADKLAEVIEAAIKGNDLLLEQALKEYRGEK